MRLEKVLSGAYLLDEYNADVPADSHGYNDALGNWVGSYSSVNSYGHISFTTGSLYTLQRNRTSCTTIPSRFSMRTTNGACGGEVVFSSGATYFAAVLGKDTGDNCYYLKIERTQAKIIKRIAGSETTLATVSISVSDGADVPFYFFKNGTQLGGSVAGVALSATDNNPHTNTYGYLYLGGSGTFTVKNLGVFRSYKITIFSLPSGAGVTLCRADTTIVAQGSESGGRCTLLLTDVGYLYGYIEVTAGAETKRWPQSGHALISGGNIFDANLSPDVHVLSTRGAPEYAVNGYGGCGQTIDAGDKIHFIYSRSDNKIIGLTYIKATGAYSQEYELCILPEHHDGWIMRRTSTGKLRFLYGGYNSSLYFRETSIADDMSTFGANTTIAIGGINSGVQYVVDRYDNDIITFGPNQYAYILFRPNGESWANFSTKKTIGTLSNGWGPLSGGMDVDDDPTRGHNQNNITLHYCFGMYNGGAFNGSTMKNLYYLKLGIGYNPATKEWTLAAKKWNDQAVSLPLIIYSDGTCTAERISDYFPVSATNKVSAQYQHGVHGYSIPLQLRGGIPYVATTGIRAENLWFQTAPIVLTPQSGAWQAVEYEYLYRAFMLNIAANDKVVVPYQYTGATHDAFIGVAIINEDLSLARDIQLIDNTNPIKEFAYCTWSVKPSPCGNYVMWYYRDTINIAPTTSDQYERIVTAMAEENQTGVGMSAVFWAEISQLPQLTKPTLTRTASDIKQVSSITNLIATDTVGFFYRNADIITTVQPHQEWQYVGGVWQQINPGQVTVWKLLDDSLVQVGSDWTAVEAIVAATPANIKAIASVIRGGVWHYSAQSDTLAVKISPTFGVPILYRQNELLQVIEISDLLTGEIPVMFYRDANDTSGIMPHEDTNNTVWKPMTLI